MDSIDPTAYNDKQLATIIKLREELSANYTRVNSDEQDQFNKRATDSYREIKGSGDIRGLGNVKVTINKLESIESKIKAARKERKKAPVDNSLEDSKQDINLSEAWRNLTGKKGKVKVTFPKTNHSEIDKCLIVLSCVVKVLFPLLAISNPDNLFGVKTKGR